MDGWMDGGRIEGRNDELYIRIIGPYRMNIGNDNAHDSISRKHIPWLYCRLPSSASIVEVNRTQQHLSHLFLTALHLDELFFLLSKFKKIFPSSHRIVCIIRFANNLFYNCPCLNTPMS